jgi:lysozyme
MTLRFQVSPAAMAQIKLLEGFRARAARLPDGRWTVGHGHVLSTREGTEVSPQQADLLLRYDLNIVAQALADIVFTPLGQNQTDALISFVYNIGLEAFRTSSVLSLINEGALLQAAAAMEQWRRAPLEGRSLVVDGLVRRRAAEKALFLTPEGGWTLAPTHVLVPQADPSGQLLTGEQAPVVVDTPMQGDVGVATLVTSVPEPELESEPEPEPPVVSDIPRDDLLQEVLASPFEPAALDPAIIEPTEAAEDAPADFFLKFEPGSRTSSTGSVIEARRVMRKRSITEARGAAKPKAAERRWLSTTPALLALALAGSALVALGVSVGVGPALHAINGVPSMVLAWGLGIVGLGTLSFAIGRLLNLFFPT